MKLVGISCMMNVNSVRIFLNKDDGSQLAMLVQEKFQMDLKVSDAYQLVMFSTTLMKISVLVVGSLPYSTLCHVC